MPEELGRDDIEAGFGPNAGVPNDAAFLGKQESPPSLCCSWLGSGYTWVKSKAKYINYAVSAGTAAPTAMNALAAYSADKVFGAVKSIKNINTWWPQQGLEKMGLSVASGIASFAVNTMSTVYFFPKAVSYFAEEYKKAFLENDRSWQTKLKFFALCFFGMSGGVAMAAIASDSFNFLGEASLAFAALNFISFATSRFSSTVGNTNDWLKRKENNLRYDWIEKLKRLDPAYEQEFKELMAEVKSLYKNKSAEALYEAIFEALINKANDLEKKNKHYYLTKTKSESAKEYGQMLFDFTLAAIMGFAALPINIQKSSDGLKLLTYGYFSQLNPWAQRSIGFLLSLSSVKLYILCGLDVRKIVVPIAEEIFKNPNLLKVTAAVSLLIANGLSGAGPYGIVANVMINDNNLIWLSENTLSQVYALTFAAAGAIVNLKASAACTVPDFKDNNDNVELKDVLTYYSVRGHRPKFFEVPTPPPVPPLYQNNAGENRPLLKGKK